MGADVGANDDSAKHSQDGWARPVHGHDEPRPAPDGHRRPFRSQRVSGHPGQGAPRPRDRECHGLRPPRRPGRLPVPAEADRGGYRVTFAVRLVRRRPRVDLPAGEAVRDRERAESAGLLAPAVRLHGSERIGPGVRAVPRGRVRHAEGRRPGDLRGRRRSLAARERSSAREEQHLDLAGSLPARARHLVPQERSHAPSHGCVQLPPVSQRGDRSARARIRVAERGIRQPRPHQAGAVGRFSRDRAAHHGRRLAAPSRRGRLAGRHLAPRIGYTGSRTFP